MEWETNRKTKDKSGNALLYGRKIFEALILIAIICWLVFSVWNAYHGMDEFRFGGLPTLVIRYVLLLLLIPYTIHFIVTIPEKVRDIKDNERRLFEECDILMGGYAASDEGFRDEMVRILRMMGEEREQEEYYSYADAACDKLLKEGHAPEEQAAVHYCKMICQDKLGYTKEAITHGEQALSLRKGYFPALQKTVELCLKVNKLSTAEQWLLEAREVDQQEALWINIALARIYMEQHHYEKALEAARVFNSLIP